MLPALDGFGRIRLKSFQFAEIRSHELDAFPVLYGIQLCPFHPCGKSFEITRDMGKPVKGDCLQKPARDQSFQFFCPDIGGFGGIFGRQVELAEV